MFKKSKLEKRVEELESELGLTYNNTDNDYGYYQNIARGFMNRMDKLEDKLIDKLKK